MGLFGNKRKFNELVDVEQKAWELTEAGYKLQDLNPTTLVDKYLDNKRKIDVQLIDLDKQFSKAHKDIREMNKKEKQYKKEMKELKKEHPWLLGFQGWIASKTLPIVLGVGAAALLPIAPFLAGIPLIATQVSAMLLGVGVSISGKLDIRNLGDKDGVRDHYASLKRQIKTNREMKDQLKAKTQRLLTEIEIKQETGLEADRTFDIIKNTIIERYEIANENGSLGLLKFYKNNEENMNGILASARLPKNTLSPIEQGIQNLQKGANQPFPGVSIESFYRVIKRCNGMLMKYETGKMDQVSLYRNIKDITNRFNGIPRSEEEETPGLPLHENEQAEVAEPEEEMASTEPEKETAEAEPKEETAEAEPEKETAEAEPEKETAEAEEPEQEEMAETENKEPAEGEKKEEPASAKNNNNFVYTGFGDGKLNSEAFTKVRNMLIKEGVLDKKFISDDAMLMCIGALYSIHRNDYFTPEQIKNIKESGDYAAVGQAISLLHDKTYLMEQDGRRKEFIDIATVYFTKYNTEYTKAYRNELNRINEEKAKAEAEVAKENAAQQESTHEDDDLEVA